MRVVRHVEAAGERGLAAAAAGLTAWVDTTAHARIQGAALTTVLAVTGPPAALARELTRAVRADLDLPLRTDTTVLAGRLTHIEVRLDDLDEQLHELSALLREARHAAA